MCLTQLIEFASKEWENGKEELGLILEKKANIKKKKP